MTAPATAALHELLPAGADHLVCVICGLVLDRPGAGATGHTSDDETDDDQVDDDGAVSAATYPAPHREETAMSVTWPDTHHEDAPVDHLYRSATWLLGRHPQLAALAQRAGVAMLGDDGEPDLDLDALGEAFVERDELGQAWKEYRDANPEPEDYAAAERWEAAGPPLGSATMQALGVMSRTEVARLRLLATFGPVRVPFKVSDLAGLDNAGQLLLADWCRAVERA